MFIWRSDASHWMIIWQGIMEEAPLVTEGIETETIGILRLVTTLKLEWAATEMFILYSTAVLAHHELLNTNTNTTPSFFLVNHIVIIKFANLIVALKFTTLVFTSCSFLSLFFPLADSFHWLHFSFNVIYSQFWLITTVQNQGSFKACLDNAFLCHFPALYETKIIPWPLAF